MISPRISSTNDVPSPLSGGDPPVWRILTAGADPPTPLDVATPSEEAPRSFRLDGARHQVTNVSGPTRLEAEWWTDEPLARDYYEVVTEEGGRYWLYRDRRSGGFFLHGVFD